MDAELVLDKLHKKPSNKSKLYNHYNIEEVNLVHEIDVLFLPHDTVPTREGPEVYKYALCVVDVASRFKAARPLQDKTSALVLNTLKRIYSHEMKLPKTIWVDGGSEFRGDVDKWLKSRNIEIVL